MSERIVQTDFSLLAFVRTTLQRARQALGKDELSLLIAVSGGEDSHALLHVLNRLAGEGRLSLAVAHFDHALRDESRKETEFVRTLAQSYSLPFASARADGHRGSENLEAWARRVRYEFLERARKARQCDLIVTAHHLNDQAETVLFRMLSGRLLTDAHSIAELDLRRRLLRPLLQVPKLMIEDYVAEHRLSFVVDSSNSDLGRTRNRIRHELLPGLEKSYNPQLVAGLAQIARRLGEDERYLDEEACRVATALGATPSSEALRSVPDALLWRVIGVYARQEMGPESERLGYRAFRSVTELLASDPHETKRLDLGFGIRCEVSPSGVRFKRVAEADDARSDIPLEPASLAIPGCVERNYGNGRSVVINAGVLFMKDSDDHTLSDLIRWTKERSKATASEGRAVEYFDLSQLAVSSLTVRERSNGDVVDVFRRGERKLKKLFLERGVARDARNAVPVVEAGTEILWVPGVARSALAPILPESRCVLELKYEPSNLK